MMADSGWYEKEKLRFAAQAGHVEKARDLLANGYNPNVFDDLSRTPLHYAAEQGNIEVMKVLIEAGADVNAHEETRIGNTPLREVAGQCSYEVARVLIDAGADPTIPGWMQITALDLSRDRLNAEGKRLYELLHKAANGK